MYHDKYSGTDESSAYYPFAGTAAGAPAVPGEASFFLWRSGMCGINLKFRRVNDTTINCIITQDDLKEYGLHIDDLFERKKEAEEFFRGIMAEAARQENFNLESEFASMKIAVLPDHSISLTLSEDPGASAAIRKVREMAGKGVGPPGDRDLLLPEKAKRQADLLPPSICSASIPFPRRPWVRQGSPGQASRLLFTGTRRKASTI